MVTNARGFGPVLWAPKSVQRVKVNEKIREQGTRAGPDNLGS